MTTYTFEQTLRSIGVRNPPAWSKQIDVKLKPRNHQLELLYQAVKNKRFGCYDDPGTGKTLPAQALALLNAGMGRKTVVVMPPKLIPQFAESFRNSFDNFPFTVETFNDELDDRQEKAEAWEKSAWPDILLTTYRAFVGYVPPTARALCQKQQDFEVKKQATLASLTSRMADLLLESLEEGMEGLAVLAVALVDACKKTLSREHKEKRTASIDGQQINWKLFKDRGYRALMVDEAQNAKHHNSQIHQAIKQFVEPDNRLLLMTGSPVHNTPEDAYGLIDLISPDIYRNYHSFEYIHCIKNPMTVGFDRITGRTKQILKTVGYKNLDKLHEALYSKGRRVTKHDVLELPPVTISHIPVTLEPRHYQLYRKIVDENMLVLDDDVVLDFTQAQRLYQALQQILINPETIARTSIGKNAMLETLTTLLDSLEGKKVLVGCWYRKTIEKCMEHYAKYSPACLYGGVSGQQAEDMKRKFIEDPECRVVFTQYASGGVGIDGFQNVCSHAVMLELMAVPGLYDQWISRINRSGQTEPQTVYMLTATGTLSVALKRNLLRKEEEANLVVMDKKQLLSNLIGEDQ